MVFAYTSLDKSSQPLEVEEPTSSFTNSLPSLADSFSKIGSVLPTVNSINPFSNAATAPAPATATATAPAIEQPEKTDSDIPAQYAAPYNIPEAIPVRGGKIANRRQTKSNMKKHSRKYSANTAMRKTKTKTKTKTKQK
jgi:hypothetical protein